jgi:Phosphotransferase enzyme family
MDRVAITSSADPLKVLEQLVGAPLTGLAVWAGKPSKTDRRIFAHVGTSDGRLWFAKISRDGGEALRGEYDAMRYVQALLHGTPYRHACNQRVDYEDGVIIQEWRAGISFRRRLISQRRLRWQRASIARDCRAVTDWLAGFHTLGAAVAPPHRALSQRGATHGDFKPANILLRGDTPLAVVDWELFDPQGVQIHDLFHFLVYFGMTVTAPDRIKGLRLTFFEQNWISDIARDCLGRYVAKLQCAPESLSSAFDHYIEATLQRRSLLGLSNTGYFLLDARRLVAEWSGTPYAFRTTTSVQSHIR